MIKGSPRTMLTNALQRMICKFLSRRYNNDKFDMLTDGRSVVEKGKDYVCSKRHARHLGALVHRFRMSTNSRVRSMRLLIGGRRDAHRSRITVGIGANIIVTNSQLHSTTRCVSTSSAFIQFVKMSTYTKLTRCFPTKQP